ncbi:hypothetical protein EDC19_1478 [Natranaerovirga hydrolytica]|uniref:Immunity protein 17 of polymorphic toxin system n=1 Tax=Natranaerovirga hydrolytica TaxID=680378 RepID=A0A4R1ML27_9FIRM|nr:CLC_0170 family protein [Natranaerovirga hydrolytica]TCK93287.1 hypothetical protein EDC19_1478 [Natranaerovirga hydrolytica]
MMEILYKLKNNFTIGVVVFMVIISLILYFVDRKRFIKNKYEKEEKIAKILSYIYFFGSIGLFIVLKIIS